LTGWLDVVWGDPQPGSREISHLEFYLADANGQVTEMVLSTKALAEAGGIMTIQHRFVEVEIEDRIAGARRLSATSIRVIPPSGGADSSPTEAVLGSKPWVTLACKFSDKSAEPENLSYFQGMYDNSPGRLDHYWREVSYDNIDIVGSTAVNWKNLPNPQTFYVPTPGSGTGANLSLLFEDCTDAADPFVDFSLGGTGGFEGINLMFNDQLDCCAWGGGRWATLDGVSKSWRTTWDPPWAFAQEGVIAHEMGHGFGLPHANNSDGDGNPYDSPWDVMSSATGYAVDDPVYGNLGKHVTSCHKDRLGWFDASEMFLVPGKGFFRVTIDPLGSATTATHRVARIPIGGSTSHYYTVEVREAVGNYEADIPGNGTGDRMVIIHEVNTGRSEPAWVVDENVPAADYASTEGVMWRVGEIFVDPAAEIAIEVEGQIATGFQVGILVGTGLFSDGFEAGDTSAWTDTVP
jgi:M6 family metalloprotease-like protein